MAKTCFTKPELTEYGIEDMSTKQKRRFIEDRLADIQLVKENNKLQAVVIDRGINQINSHPNGPKAGLKAFLYTDRTELFERSSIDARFEAFKSANQSKVYEMMGDLMPSWFGMKTKAKEQRNLIYALFGEGEKTNNGKWQKFAKDWNGLVEDLKVRFLKAGGNPKKIANWAIPQSHDPFHLNEAGFDQWYDDVLGLLDLRAMGIEASDAPHMLRAEFDRIAKGEIDPPRDSFGEGVNQAQYDESQFLKFKDADSWLNYNDKYSDSTPYMMMMDVINTRSSEIVLMEHLGPNTDIGFNTLAKAVDKKEGAGSSDFARMAYDNLAGHLNAPASTRRIADRMQAIRSFTTGLRLPSAAISVLSDVVFNTLTAKYNGLPGMKVAMGFVKNIKWENAADRKFAAQMHFTLDHLLDEATAASRFSDVQGQSMASRFSTSVMRGSGLQTLTIAGKKAFHYEFMAHLAGGSFGKRTKAAFKRYGITASDLKELKNSKKIIRDGVEYLDPAVLSQSASERVMAMLSAESKFAVPESDLMTKAAMNQGTKKGTVGGELIRTGAQFKTFPVTIIMNHWMRAMNGFEGDKGSRLAYASAMAVFTTAMGAIVLQLKEGSKGYTPRDMDTVDFWTDAALQGGSASILGDMMSSDARSFGGSLQEFLLGPSASLVNDVVWKGTLGSLDEARKGERTAEKAFKRTVGAAANYVPYQFWYTRAIMDRMFLDSMRKFGDPKWAAKKAKKEIKKRKEHGNKRYWK